MPIPTAAAPDEIAVSHCLLGADGRVLAAREADRPYYAASTIKLHVLLAALRAAADGTLDPERSVPATRTFTGADDAPFTLGGDHLDPTHPAAGEPIAIQDLLLRMIDRSSNEATNHVAELLGLDAVAATICELGLRVTRVERLIGDAAALETGATNETSAADLAMTMRAAVRGERRASSDVDTAPPSPSEAAASSADRATPIARRVLRAQRIPVIGAVLRENVEWGSKSGWVDGYRHDVAYVGDPDGQELRVLAVMTSGLAEQEADRRIEALVRELLPDLAR